MLPHNDSAKPLLVVDEELICNLCEIPHMIPQTGVFLLQESLDEVRTW